MDTEQPSEATGTTPHERFWTIQDKRDMKSIYEALDSVEKIESFYEKLFTDKFSYHDLSPLQQACLADIDFTQWWRKKASTSAGRHQLILEVDTSTPRGIRLQQNKAFRQVMATSLPEPPASVCNAEPEPPRSQPISLSAPLPEECLAQVLYQVCTIRGEEFRIYECSVPPLDEFGQADMAALFAQTFQPDESRKNVIYKTYHCSSSEPIYVSKQLPTPSELSFQLLQAERTRSKRSAAWMWIIIGLIVAYLIFC